MSKAADKNIAGMLAGAEAGAAQHKTDRRLAAEANRNRTVSLIAAELIRPREEDTRPPRASHVLTLAESIAAIGLVQPIAVDKNRRLVAGLHRLEACRLLLLKPKARHSAFQRLTGADKVEEAANRLEALPAPAKLPEPLTAGEMPCRVFTDLDVVQDQDAALAAEAAENTARREYDKAELEAVVQKLKKAGYRELKGRPKKGQKALRPALQMVLGIGPRQATNVLQKAATKPAAKKASTVATFSTALPKLAKALSAVATPKIQPGTQAPAIQEALDLAAELEAVLPAAIKEAKNLEA
jgi:ParB family chromosome partitioning protein